MNVPYVASPWKNWFRPRRFGGYVNDHTVYRDDTGNLHLIGITSKGGKPTDERYFVHADSPSFDTKMKERAKVIDTGSLAWAPCVVEKDGLYYMFYGPSPTKLAVSLDSAEWFGQEIQLNGVVPTACHRDHFVLRRSDGKWLMYATGLHEKRSSICNLISDDLLHWEFNGFALTSGPDAPLNPSWGAFESPYVVEYEGLYYLFTTYTDCSRLTYHDTLVFCSSDPCRFGCFNGGNGGAIPAAKLFAHAPEILRDGDGWRITTCGWKRSSFTKGFVSVARLDWKEKKKRGG